MGIKNKQKKSKILCAVFCRGKQIEKIFDQKVKLIKKRFDLRELGVKINLR